MISAFVNISIHIDFWGFLDDLLEHLLVKDYDNDIFKVTNMFIWTFFMNSLRICKEF
jgi:hypothetical protein